MSVLVSAKNHLSTLQDWGQKKFFPTKTKIQGALDARGNPFWTFKNFEWAYRNPLVTVFQRGNDYVTEQWSEDYFSGCKKDVGLAKDAVVHVAESLKNKEFSAAGKHLANALVVILGLAVNIEAANFIKGVLGALISTGKTAVHSLLFAVFLIGTIVCFSTCQTNLAKSCFLEMLANLGFVGKDLVSILTCIGHSIPSWLPLVILPFCPPAGIALAVVKFGSQFTGIFDVMAYGGTAVLLGVKAKFASWELEKNPQNLVAKKDLEAWQTLKKDLNPLKSIEGATLAMYGLHVALEGATTLIDYFAPGVGTAVKYASYGAQGVAGIGLTGNLVRKKIREKREAKAAQERQQKQIESIAYGAAGAVGAAFAVAATGASAPIVGGLALLSGGVTGYFKHRFVG